MGGLVHPADTRGCQHQAGFDEWRADLERRIRGDLHAALESHLAKFRSLYRRWPSCATSPTPPRAAP